MIFCWIVVYFKIIMRWICSVLSRGGLNLDVVFYFFLGFKYGVRVISFFWRIGRNINILTELFRVCIKASEIRAMCGYDDGFLMFDELKDLFMKFVVKWFLLDFLMVEFCEK